MPYSFLYYHIFSFKKTDEILSISYKRYKISLFISNLFSFSSKFDGKTLLFVPKIKKKIFSTFLNRKYLLHPISIFYFVYKIVAIISVIFPSFIVTSISISSSPSASDKSSISQLSLSSSISTPLVYS